MGKVSNLSMNITQCPQPVLEPGPIDLETSSLTMRPPHFQKSQLLLGLMEYKDKGNLCGARI